MKYTLDTPYPSIKELDTNIEYSQIILSNLGGLHSEMNAVSLYFYNHIILENQWPQLSKAMIQIAIVEMRHLQILGELIRELGVYPIYLDPIVDQHEFWSAKYVNYEVNLKEMLILNMEAEQKAILQYNSLIHVIEEEDVKTILKRIVLDERLHLEIFEKLLQSLT